MYCLLHWFSTSFPPLNNPVRNGPLYQVLVALYLWHRFPDVPSPWWYCVRVSMDGMESPSIPEHRNYERSPQQISPLSSWVCVWVAELNWLRKTNRQRAHCYPSALVGGPWHPLWRSREQRIVSSVHKIAILVFIWKGHGLYFSKVHMWLSLAFIFSTLGNVYDIPTLGLFCDCLL